MTLNASLLDELSGAAATTDLDADSDVGFFSMSPASAEQITVQISGLLDRGWEYVALAYKGRAFMALGYSTWDAYVDARFGEFRIAVPREHRAEAIASLAEVRMSVRAIAKLLGVGVGTVHRSLMKMSGVPNGTADDGTAAGTTLGADGKEYPRRRKVPDRSCSLCGDSHPADIKGCPWDQYAQGIGPHPDAGDAALADDDEFRSLDQDVAGGDWDNLPEPRPAANDIDPPRPRARSKGGSNLAFQAIEAMQSVADQVTTLPDLLSDIECAIESDKIVAQSDLLSLRLRRLDHSIGEGLESWRSIVQRLRVVVRSIS